MSGVATEALLAAGYAVFLLFAALALDVLAGHTHRRSLRFRTAGFTYHDHIDAWICPEGEHLWPIEDDRERRLVRYRARPQVCNACPVKGVAQTPTRGARSSGSSTRGSGRRRAGFIVCLRSRS